MANCDPGRDGHRQPAACVCRRACAGVRVPACVCRRVCAGEQSAGEQSAQRVSLTTCVCSAVLKLLTSDDSGGNGPGSGYSPLVWPDGVAQWCGPVVWLIRCPGAHSCPLHDQSLSDDLASDFEEESDLLLS